MTPSEAVDKFGSQTAAARAWGIPRTTFRDILTRSLETTSTGAGISFHAIPAENLPIERLIDNRLAAWQQKHLHRTAATWQRVDIHEDLPYGLVLMGDVHIDDDGCNWDQLLEDVKLMKETDGCWCINVGDYTNNWVGNLARLYGEQDASKETARRLAKWLLCDSGIRWAAVVLGNHDQWNEGATIIKQMVGQAPIEIPVHEWTAKIEFKTPNGNTCRVNASHDFKGKNQFSTTHGPLKEAIWMQDGADVLVGGHIHFGGLQQVELPGGHGPWLVRVRGYKSYDSHALVNGFHEGKRFASVMALIDPDAPQGEHVCILPSVKQGTEVLKHLRAARRKEKKNGKG